LAGMNLSIDGKPVAQLKSPRFTCVEVAAGKRVLTAQFGGLAGPQSKAGEITVDAPSGGVVAVRLTVGMGLVQNAVEMTPQTDLPATMRTLAAMPMTPADAAAL